MKDREKSTRNDSFRLAGLISRLDDSIDVNVSSVGK